MNPWIGTAVGVFVVWIVTRALVRHMCADHQPSTRRYWAELEMKLQLSAEDMEMVLQEHSLQALQRIPTAVHEVKRMQVRFY